jgi:hypothetical protein
MLENHISWDKIVAEILDDGRSLLKEMVIILRRLAM